ncbi:MAG: TonB-dependent receptor [Prevotella sp.]|jgi:hypothetical protein|nr:TonB-dependent receptor [Prevotella sp.]
MRLIFLLLRFLIAYALFAQSPDDKITVKMKQAGLKEFIKEIESQTKYRFVYGEDLILRKTITLSMKNEPLKQVLSKAFMDKEIEYEIKASHIVLGKGQRQEKTPSKRKFTVSGYITDGISGETLIGANIYNTDSKEGTVTNEYGFYSLTLPEGTVTFRYSCIGRQPQEIAVTLDKNIEQNIKLSPGRQLSEVVVYGDRVETGVNATQTGALDIPLDVMKSAPALLGEADIMKTVQMMPGVQAGTEGSAGVYVRGGGADENLILLDGVPLYNADHLFGFFSVFTPDAIKKVSLFKGSFPAHFGGRLSSVIDVRTNDGDMKSYHGAIGIGLLSSKLQFEGPIVKDRTSFNISARRSYWDLVAKPFMGKDDKFGYYFYDLNAKVNHRFSDHSRMFISLYNGKDKMDTEFRDESTDYTTMDKGDLHWSNFLSAVKWNCQITPKFFSNTTLAYTHYKFNVDSKYYERSVSKNYENNYSSEYSSGIKDMAFNIDLDYHPLPNHHIKFGGGYLNHRFQPEVQTSRIKYNENGIATDTTYSSMSDSRIQAHESNVYVEDILSAGSRFSTNFGFHLSLFNVSNKTYTSFQPRISARYQLTDDIALKASYTKMSQYIHLLSSYTITMPTDLWAPATPRIKPMQAHQFSLGGYYTGFKGLELSVEAYYKDMHNVLEYKDGASFLGSSHNWEDKVETGKGRAMGVEFMLQKKAGKTTGWLACTLARSDRKFSEDGINNGKRFPYRYDRRHHINAVINHKFSDKVDIGASWEFYTGGTTTIAEEKTAIIRPDGDNALWWGTTSEVNYIDNRNNYRMSGSHRLNVGINFNKKTKRGMRTWNISVYNVYNAMNPTFIYRTTKESENGYNGGEKAILKKVTILPFIPSVSYIYKF